MAKKKKQAKGRGGMKMKNAKKATGKQANSQPSKTSVSTPVKRRRLGTWHGCIFIPDSWERKKQRQTQDAEFTAATSHLRELSSKITSMLDGEAQSLEDILATNSEEERRGGFGTDTTTVPFDPEKQELREELETQIAMEADFAANYNKRRGTTPRPKPHVSKENHKRQQA